MKPATRRRYCARPTGPCRDRHRQYHGHRGLIFRTDDRAARKAARRHRIPISGSLGCLVACVERGLTDADQANSWLNRMIEQGFRSPVQDLRELMKS